MEITKYVPVLIEPWWVTPVCWLLDSITTALKANNDKHWHPTDYAEIAREQARIQRETEAAGEFWCVYLEGGHDLL